MEIKGHTEMVVNFNKSHFLPEMSSATIDSNFDFD